MDTNFPVRQSSAPAPPQSAPTFRSSGAAQGAPPASAPLMRMPTELLYQIAGELAPADVLRFATVNHATRQTLPEYELSARLVIRTDAMWRWHQFIDILQRMRDISTPALRVAPITALARRIDALPRRHDAFDATLDALQELPLARRAEPLAALATQIFRLPRFTRVAALQRFLAAAARLPASERIRPLMQVTWQMSAVPEASQWTASRIVLESAAELRESARVAPLLLLVRQTYLLPEPQRLFALQRILESAARLSAPYRAEVLTEIPPQWDRLAVHERETLLKSILDLTNHIDACGLDPLFANLLSRLPLLKENIRAPLCEDLLARLASWAPRAGSAALAALSAQLETLPATDRRAIFENIENACLALPLAARVKVRCAQLSQVFALAEQIRPRIFHTLLRDALGLAAEHRAAALEQCAIHLDVLAAPERREAQERIFAATMELPLVRRGASLDQQARHLHLLPATDQASAFEGLLGAITRLPESQLYPPLTTLIHEIGRLQSSLRGQVTTCICTRLSRLPPYCRTATMLVLARWAPHIAAACRSQVLEAILGALVDVPRHSRLLVWQLVEPQLAELGEAERERLSDRIEAVRRVNARAPLPEALNPA